MKAAPGQSWLRCVERVQRFDRDGWERGAVDTEGVSETEGGLGPELASAHLLRTAHG